MDDHSRRGLCKMRANGSKRELELRPWIQMEVPLSRSEGNKENQNEI